MSSVGVVDDTTRHERSSVRRRRARTLNLAFIVVAAVLLYGAGWWFVRFVLDAQGAVQTSALFVGGLLVVGVMLMIWAYVRRPLADETDDFFDKFLARTGEAVLLGAILSFGFGLVGQKIDDERGDREVKRDTVLQLRLAAGGRVFQDVDVSGESFRRLDLSGFDLSGANLHSTTVSGAILVSAQLEARPDEREARRD